MHTMIRRGGLLVASLLALLLYPVPAAALAAGTGAAGPSGVTMSPDRVERDLAGRDIAETIRVQNDEKRPLRVTFSITGLAHDLEGTPQFPAGGPTGLRVQPTEALMLPGQIVSLNVTGRIPDGQPAVYAGVAITLPASGTGQVAVVNRVAAALLLRGPKPWVERLEVGEITLRPAGDGNGAVVQAVVRNTGNVHVKPAGRVTVTRPDGSLLGTYDLPGQNILPGLARTLGAPVQLPAGTSGPIGLEVRLAAPPATGRTEIVYDPAGPEAVGPGTPGEGGLGGSEAATATSTPLLGAPSAPERNDRRERGFPWWLLVLLLLLALWATRRYFRRNRSDGNADSPISEVEPVVDPEAEAVAQAGAAAPGAESEPTPRPRRRRPTPVG